MCHCCVLACGVSFYLCYSLHTIVAIAFLCPRTLFDTHLPLVRSDCLAHGYIRVVLVAVQRSCTSLPTCTPMYDNMPLLCHTFGFSYSFFWSTWYMVFLMFCVLLLMVHDGIDRSVFFKSRSRSGTGSSIFCSSGWMDGWIWMDG